MNFTQTLQMLLEQKGGALINEVLNPPEYLRKSAGVGASTAAR